MKKKVINYLMSSITKEKKYDKDKLEQIQYGLEGLYTIITKSIGIIILAIILNFFKELIYFLLLYIPLRSVGFGTHAKSNLQCWIYSIILIVGLPYLFHYLDLSKSLIIIIWTICFINYFIFCPADTEKRPMISNKRKLKFKIAILIISFVYLILLLNFNYIYKFVLPAMILEMILTNPIGYIIMGQKVRFRLNYINLSKIRMEVK